MRSGEIERDDQSAGASPTVLNFSVNLAPETIFREVQRLSAGNHAGGSRTDACALEKYWDMRYGVGRRHQ